MAKFNGSDRLQALADGSNQAIASVLAEWMFRNIKINMLRYQKKNAGVMSGLEHQFNNKYLIPQTVPFIELHHKHWRKSAILIGAGPSYQKEIPLLRMTPRDILICSVDRCAADLLKAGVRVDYIFCVDVESKPILANTENSHLFFDMATNPALPKAFKGEKTMYRTVYPGQLEPMALRIGAGDPWCPLLGGNVSSSMFGLTRDWLGCWELVFVGHDFCYSEPRPGQNTDFPYIVNGKFLWTYPGYEMFKLWTELHIGDEDHPVRYVNASLGGILGIQWNEERESWENLDGIERMTFSDWLRQNEKVKLSKMLFTGENGIWLKDRKQAYLNWSKCIPEMSIRDRVDFLEYAGGRKYARA